MSKNKFTIAFKNIYQMWNFAQKINATNIEIITTDMTLICDCTDEDLKLLSKYNGEVVRDYSPVHHQRSFNRN